MDTIWQELLHRTIEPGLFSFVIRGTDVQYQCPICGTEYPQTDEGRRNFKDHEFTAHQTPTLFDWWELQGKTLTIAVVERVDPDPAEGGRPDWGTYHQRLMPKDSMPDNWQH